MEKIQKGTYGYLNWQKKVETIKTILLFSMALAIFGVGYITTGTKENLLTVVAVASVLPAAKQMTTTVLYYKYPSGNEESYKRIQKEVKNATCLSDIVITSYDKITELLHVAVLGNTIIAFSHKEKTEEKSGAEFIKQTLERNGYKGISVKIYKDEKSYITRLKEMQENLEKERKIKNEEEIASVIKAISI